MKIFVLIKFWEKLVQPPFILAHLPLLLAASILCSHEVNAATVSLNGCAGDGVTDDTACFQKAVDAADKANAIDSTENETLYIPPPAKAYRITRPIIVKCPIKITSNYAKLFLDFPLDAPNKNGVGFYIASSNVSVEKIWFDAADAPSIIPLVDRAAIWVIGPSSSKHIDHVSITNCKFTNLMQYNLSGDPYHRNRLPYILGYFDGIYIKWADYVTVQSNEFQSLSGAAIFMVSTKNGSILNNLIDNTIIYSIHLEADNHGTEIGSNTLTCSRFMYCRYWGGAIDVMGQHSHVPDIGPDTLVHIHDNTITGKMMYGAAIRFGSTQDAVVDHNTIKDIAPYPASLIAIPARGGAGIDMSHRNPKNFVIDSNILQASGTNNIGIYFQNNQPQGAKNLPPGENITITNNKILSVDAADYFQNGIIIHGMNSGYNKIIVSNNTYSGRPLKGPVAGGFSFVSSTPQGSVHDLTIDNNTLTWFTANGQLSPAPPNTNGVLAAGMVIGQYTDKIEAQGNTFDGWGTQIYVDEHAGDNISHLENNNFHNTVFKDIIWNGKKPNTASPSLKPVVGAAGILEKIQKNKTQ